MLHNEQKQCSPITRIERCVITAKAHHPDKSQSVTDKETPTRVYQEKDGSRGWGWGGGTLKTEEEGERKEVRNSSQRRDGGKRVPWASCSRSEGHAQVPSRSSSEDPAPPSITPQVPASSAEGVFF